MKNFIKEKADVPNTPSLAVNEKERGLEREEEKHYSPLNPSKNSPVKMNVFKCPGFNSFVETQTNVKKYQTISLLESQQHINSFENFNVFLANSPHSNHKKDHSTFLNYFNKVDDNHHINLYETSNQKSLAS